MKRSPNSTRVTPGTVSPVQQGIRSPANGYELRSDQPKPTLRGISDRGIIGSQKGFGKKK